MKSSLIIFVVLIGAGICAVAVCNAATIHVPADQPTIQAGIDAAGVGDTVLVAPGTYTGSGNVNLDLLGKQLVVRGSDGYETTIIDCQNSSRAFYIRSGEDTTAVIDGFSILDGNTSPGGGISISNSSPKIINCYFEGCTRGEEGSAIYANESSSPIIRSNIFRNNISPSINISTSEAGTIFEKNLVTNETGGSCAIVIRTPMAHIINNTVANIGAGGYATNGGQEDFRNNIVVNCTRYGVYGCEAMDYNDIWNANPDYSGGSVAGANDISDDPIFVDSAAYSYELQESSPCIDAGDPDPQYNDPDGTRNDMGALPYDHHVPTTIIVPDQYLTIQEAVDSSHAGDTILIRDGTYSEHIRIAGKDILFRSETGAENCSIISDTSRCFSIEYATISIEGLTLTGKIVTGNGCAINATNSTVTLSRCDVINSECVRQNDARGGGIYASGTTLNINSCHISNNTLSVYSYAAGGGIYVEGTMIIDSSLISKNSLWSYAPDGYLKYGADGAGIYIIGDNVKISNSDINDNYLFGIGNGCGINLSGDYFIIENSNIQNNDLSCSGRYGGDSHGGGLAITGSDGIVSDCVILQNSAWAGSSEPAIFYCLGGGLYIEGNNIVSNNLIHGNSATSSNWPTSSQSTYAAGGGIYSNGSNLLNHNTIVGNSARASNYGAGTTPFARSLGGGCYIEGTLDNNIVAYNWVESDCSQSADPENCSEETFGSGVYSSAAANSCNLYFGNSGAPDWYGDISPSNINHNPLLCDTAMSNFALMDISPAVPENNDCGEWIGAFEIGCTGKPIIASHGILNEEADHVIENVPTFWWDYQCPLGNPEDSFAIAVGTDDEWTYAEMWNPAPFPGPDTSVTYAGAALIDGETYYLRLRVHNGLAWSDWYEMSFRMNSVPNIPVPLSPINDAVVNSSTVSLYMQNTTDAEGDPLLYGGMLYSYDFNDTMILADVPEQPDSTAITFGNYPDNCHFWWKARAFDGYEYSPLSDSQTFWVNATEQFPAAFDLIWPPDTGWSQVYDFPPNFQWQASSDPDPLDSVYYRLKIAIDSDFTFTATYDSIYQTNYSVPSLEYGRHYWWKVSAIDTKGNTTPSTGVADFMTWILGDANADFSVNIGDGVFLINYIFKNGPAPAPLKAGDVNADCQVNVADAVCLITYIFKGGDPPGIGCAQ